MAGVAARSATFAVVAMPSRVLLSEMQPRGRTAAVRRGRLRLSSAEPSTPISAASHTESSSDDSWLLLWISSCCLTSESRALRAWTRPCTCGSGVPLVFSVESMRSLVSRVMSPSWTGAVAVMPVPVPLRKVSPTWVILETQSRLGGVEVRRPRRPA